LLNVFENKEDSPSRGSQYTRSREWGTVSAWGYAIADFRKDKSITGGLYEVIVRRKYDDIAPGVCDDTPGQRRSGFPLETYGLGQL